MLLGCNAPNQSQLETKMRIWILYPTLIVPDIFQKEQENLLVQLWTGSEEKDATYLSLTLSTGMQRLDTVALRSKEQSIVTMIKLQITETSTKVRLQNASIESSTVNSQTSQAQSGSDPYECCGYQL